MHWNNVDKEEAAEHRETLRSTWPVRLDADLQHVPRIED
jgi:hypothetical protein